MLRRTVSNFAMSPYMLFISDLAKTGKLKGIRTPGKFVGKKYRQLSAKEKAALQQRAKQASTPAMTAYRRMAHREMSNKSVPIEQRRANLTKKWNETKQAQREKAQKAQKKTKSAKSKVKKAAKKSKKSKK
uniref:kinetoplast-associated protein 2-1 n=2 Tax=Crithidia fasciculata TaxID=5656 RepID=KAP21_CRIFA|nr:RecName: Full=kinetoplast-associated protein 2-1; AltName: Full=Histone H1-like protein p18-1; Flags: Precursor [Crithidia fasciculata]AAC47741.1 kinetoplast-associated protein p18-2 [Crithidia fasciculata]prf//2206467A histone H1-like protein [Crithidia fasciculata]